MLQLTFYCYFRQPLKVPQIINVFFKYAINLDYLVALDSSLDSFRYLSVY